MGELTNNYIINMAIMCIVKVVHVTERTRKSFKICPEESWLTACKFAVLPNRATVLTKARGLNDAFGQKNGRENGKSRGVQECVNRLCHHKYLPMVIFHGAFVL